MVQQRGPVQSLTDPNIIIPSARAVGPQESLVIGDMSFNTAPVHRLKSNGESDIYIRTPMNLERRILHPAGLSDHQTETEHTEMGEALGWRSTEFSLSQQLYGGEATENAQFLEMFEDDYIGGGLGYFAPFEFTTQDDMLSAAVFAGDKGPQNSRDFGSQS